MISVLYRSFCRLSPAGDKCQSILHLPDLQSAGENACINHKVEAKDLNNFVLKDIQDLAVMALKDANAFYGCFFSRMKSRYMEDVSGMQKECGYLDVSKVIYSVL